MAVHIKSISECGEESYLQETCELKTTAYQEEHKGRSHPGARNPLNKMAVEFSRRPGERRFPTIGASFKQSDGSVEVGQNPGRTLDSAFKQNVLKQKEVLARGLGTSSSFSNTPQCG